MGWGGAACQYPPSGFAHGMCGMIPQTFQGMLPIAVVGEMGQCLHHRQTLQHIHRGQRTLPMGISA